MNASKFMDKQIMELSGSGAQSGGGGGDDFLELLGENHQNNGAGGKKDEILPSYDFQPIRTVGSSSAAAGGADGGRTWGSADSSMAGGSNFRTRGRGGVGGRDALCTSPGDAWFMLPEEVMPPELQLCKVKQLKRP